MIRGRIEKQIGSEILCMVPLKLINNTNQLKDTKQYPKDKY